MVLAMGFDPTIGFLHAYEPRRSTLIFDLMEPLRPVMDRRILDFIFSNKFTPHDFVVSNMGVCKLHPQLARIIVKLVQDMPEVEEITTANLKHLLKHSPNAVRNAAKNAANYKNRNTGKREKASS